MTQGTPGSTAGTTDPVVIQLDQAAQLSRIADALDTIIDMIKKDQEETKKRWEEKDIEERYDQITKEMKEEDKKRWAEKDE
jgi:hypothetical protein